MKIKKIGIIANIKKSKSRDYTISLRNWLIARDLEVFLERSIAEMIGIEDGLERKALVASVDLLIVFGGDGTILRTARFVVGIGTPIIGINLGDFGYLTEVNLNEMYSALEIILQGDVKLDRRMMLEAEINEHAKGDESYSVLNDVVINRANLSRIVELETYVNDRYLITYKADGLIISTPTGSTAYSLSAGGPIVTPDHNAIIINPICPHSLTNRPIILPFDACVQVILRTKEQGAVLTFDGQVSFTLKTGDILKVRKSDHVTTLVSSPHRDYFEILRNKLGWGRIVPKRKK